MRATRIGIAVAVAVTAQTTYALFVNGTSANVDFPLVVVVFAALSGGPIVGLWTGVAAGLGQDLLSGGIVGVSGLSKSLVGFAVGAAFAIGGISFAIFVVLTSGFGQYRGNAVGSSIAAIVFGVLFGFGVESLLNVPDTQARSVQSEVENKNVVVQKTQKTEVPKDSGEPMESKTMKGHKSKSKSNAKAIATARKLRNKTEKRLDRKRKNRGMTSDDDYVDPYKAAPVRIVPNNEKEIEEPLLDEDEPKPDVATEIPMSVVSEMLDTNQQIKKCFLAERTDNGIVPERVPIRIVVNKSGRMKRMFVSKGKYVGSGFSNCLRTAIRKIKFPLFEGADQEIKYTLN